MPGSCRGTDSPLTLLPGRQASSHLPGHVTDVNVRCQSGRFLSQVFRSSLYKSLPLHLYVGRAVQFCSDNDIDVLKYVFNDSHSRHVQNDIINNMNMFWGHRHNKIFAIL